MPDGMLGCYYPGSGVVALSPALTRAVERGDEPVACAALVLCHEICHGVTAASDLDWIEEACVELLAWELAGELLELASYRPSQRRRLDRPAWGLVSSRRRMLYPDLVRRWRRLCERAGVDPVEQAWCTLTDPAARNGALRLAWRSQGRPGRMRDYIREHGRDGWASRIGA